MVKYSSARCTNIQVPNWPVCLGTPRTSNNSDMRGIFLALFVGYATAQQYMNAPEVRPLPKLPFLRQPTDNIYPVHPIYGQQLPQQQPQQRQQPQPFDSSSITKQSRQQNVTSHNNNISVDFYTVTAPPRAALGPAAAAPTHSAAPLPVFVPAPSAAVASVAPNSHNRFSADLFHVIGPAHAHQNIVYSPISLQTLLALLYTGASGQTASELQRALAVPSNKHEVAAQFRRLLQAQSNGADAQLVMANKLYYRENLQLELAARQTARDSFGSDIEGIQFAAAAAAAEKMNDWVARQTHNHIRSLVSAQQLNARTQAVLLNAIYFKAKWAREFSAADTDTEDFHVNTRDSVPVPMMFNDATYRYGEFEDLQATALELPYRDSDLSMLILLPNAVDGLPLLEQRMRDIDLNKLSSQLSAETVTVRMPKFRINFELDMVEPLKNLGIKELFSENAQLYDFFRSQPVGVSSVQHKAYLDVNEAGSEAAAASFITLVPLSLPSRIVHFTANHPFMFAIRSPQAIYFVGHVVTF